MRNLASVGAHGAAEAQQEGLGNSNEVDDRVDTPPQSLNRGSNPRNRRLAIEEVEDRRDLPGEVEISRLAGALIDGPA